MTDAISSSDSFSRRRAAARWPRLLGPGLVDALGRHRHVGQDGHLVGRDVDEPAAYREEPLTPVLLDDDLAGDHLGDERDVHG